MSNAADLYKKRLESLRAKLPDIYVDYSKRIGLEFVEEVRKRTPEDYGELRAAWAQMPVEKKENRYIITITNPQKYAAFVEFGYAQRPGMILKMRMERGRLRFQKLIGYAKNYKVGDPKGKVQPDENGDYYICTRKRFIPGKFMAREGLKEMDKRVKDYQKEIINKCKKYLEGKP